MFLIFLLYVLFINITYIDSLEHYIMSYFESLFSLNNKISIVTGASRGNGKSIAEALLRAGSTVILIDISKKELSKTVKEFQNENLKAFEFFCDITKKKERSQLLKYDEFANVYRKIYIETIHNYND